MWNLFPLCSASQFSKLFTKEIWIVEQKGISIFFSGKKFLHSPPQERACPGCSAYFSAHHSRAQKMSYCISLHIRRDCEWEIQVFTAGVYAAVLELECLWKGACAWSIMSPAPPAHPSTARAVPTLILGDQMLLIQQHMQELRKMELLAFLKKAVNMVQFLNDMNELFFHVSTFTACLILVFLGGFTCCL